MKRGRKTGSMGHSGGEMNPLNTRAGHHQQRVGLQVGFK